MGQRVMGGSVVPSERAMDPARLGRLVVAMLLFLSVITLGSPFPGVTEQRWFQMELLTAAGVIGWAVALLWPGRVDRRFVLAVVVNAGAITVAGFASRYPSLSATALWEAVMKYGLALLLWAWASRTRGRDEAVALTLATLVTLLVVFLVEVGSYWSDWLRLGGAISALPLRPALAGGIASLANWLGDYLVLLGPVAVLAAWRGLGRPAGITLGALTQVALVLTGTRSLWLVEAIVLVPVFAASSRRLRALDRRALVVASGAVIVGVVVALAVVLPRVSRDLDEGRTSGFATAVEDFSGAPLLGIGPGGYGAARLGRAIASPGWYVYPNSHNIVLTTASETGLLGLGGAALALAALAAVLRERWRADDADRPLITASLAGLAMLVLHSMVDVAIDVPGLMAASMLVLGIGAGGLRSATSGNPRGAPTRQPWTSLGRLRPRLAPFAGVVLVLAAAPGFVRVEGAVADYQASLGALDAGDAASALDSAMKARAAAPDFTPATTVAALALDRLGRVDEAIPLADEVWRRLGFLHDGLRLASLLDRAGRVDEAVSLARTLAARRPSDPIVQLNAALMLAEAGDQAAAREAWAEAVAAEPGLAGRMADLSTAGRSALSTGYREAVLTLTSGGDGWQALAVALAADDLSTARQIVAEAGTADAHLLELALAAWQGDGSARMQLEEAGLAGVDVSDTLKFAWALAFRDCQVSDAYRWAHLSRIQAGDLGSVTAVGRSPIRTPLAGTFRYPAGIWHVSGPKDSWQIGTWVYTRETIPSC